LKFHQECLELSRKVKDEMRESISLNNLTFTYWQLGDVRRSSESQQACLEIKRKLGDRRGEALSLINLAEIEQYQGYDTAAEKRLTTALQLLREVGDKHNEARCLYSLAKFQIEKKKLPQAIATLEVALMRVKAIDAKPEQAEILAELATVYEQTGQTEKALTHYKQSFALEKELLQTKAAQKLKVLQAQFQVEQAERENERLKQELELKRRSLQVSALAITNKNETLKAIRRDILEARREIRKKLRDKLLSNLIASIDVTVDSERAWSLLEKELSVLNHDVMQRLANRFPELSPQELKICSMLREDIKTKQIALLLNLSPRTIEKHRENIRRIFRLAKKQSLSAFLASI
jgi:DNA-binding CsgD family transcriptional regulator/Flp pilus assembly protein TadD